MIDFIWNYRINGIIVFVCLFLRIRVKVGTLVSIVFPTFRVVYPFYSNINSETKDISLFPGRFLIAISGKTLWLTIAIKWHSAAKALKISRGDKHDRPAEFVQNLRVFCAAFSFSHFPRPAKLTRLFPFAENSRKIQAVFSKRTKLSK